ncbi:hypothetical protein DPM33_04995 [Mesorhizobium hawassense]|uniref:Uncharacterized protein n=1 Tax=Mesorhizobium hawassense TaxID=1209954 RepID=A0A330HVM8_9HYPH|nr:hypothetical protein [Mesorhizobium hawassense]RAZ91838.1 hypothetical protein DPM33_04995 [Mesorhizobium hawassense]
MKTLNIIAASAFVALTAPSLALAGVHSLRADNGDFDTWGADAVKTPQSFGLVDAIQTGSNGSTGTVSTSKCLGVSPRMYDPVSPDCRN